MTSEQPNLFDPEIDRLPEPAVPGAAVTNTPFLPGLKADEGYPHIQDWSLLEQEVAQCRACVLRAGCRQAVFGEGAHPADVMLVGEGPGQSEDELGRPFVGRAGQLLNKILAAAGITRSHVYITNVVKCRPPQNRLPNPQEIASCRGYLEAQIRMIKPSILVCLGALATQTVIEARAKITVVRGKWFTRDNVLIMPTYHPAALLRNESLKRPVWEDFKQIRAEIEKRGLKV